jgi:hypothetical protein
MHDGVEIGQRLRVGEDEVGDGRRSACRPLHDAGPKRSTIATGWAARLLQLAGDGVGASRPRRTAGAPTTRSTSPPIPRSTDDHHGTRNVAPHLTARAPDRPGARRPSGRPQGRARPWGEWVVRLKCTPFPPTGALVDTTDAADRQPNPGAPELNGRPDARAEAAAARSRTGRSTPTDPGAGRTRSRISARRATAPPARDGIVDSVDRVAAFAPRSSSSGGAPRSPRSHCRSTTSTTTPRPSPCGAASSWPTRWCAPRTRSVPRDRAQPGRGRGRGRPAGAGRAPPATGTRR